jgi:Uma2 family endonuclease
MAVPTEVVPVTAEQLAESVPDDKRIELVRGEVVEMSPAGFDHGAIALAVGSILREFVRRRALGTVTAAETGFILSRDPDTVRAPDAAFVARERVVRQGRPEGFFEGAPDLAVEVVSPHDRDLEVEEKILDYLRAGTRMVWVIRPRSKTVTVYSSFSDIRVFLIHETLDGGDVLPGLEVPVRELFE